MSNPKITPKNLSYNSTLPPFLQRLQSNHPSSSRHEYAIARPIKPRNEEEDRESEPVVFDEGSGETWSKEEWELREKEGRIEGEGTVEDGEGEEREKGEKREGKEAVAVVGIGGSKKRKVGRVIGGDEDGEDEVEESPDNSNAPKKDPAKQTPGKSTKSGVLEKKSPKAPAKKEKKIKLSFGDDE